ncbi:Cytidine and dCMP deaminase domain-containing protein 1 [Chelonia mydas]|uniref:dCMP deaminase n=1 Tax=Chelonia mydas TaxID=8469 RepID=M7AZG5_CHEMY|nr:Cytidine and dCMP deaminase domain-containing protein 1 [Chelonia mydas]
MKLQTPFERFTWQHQLILRTAIVVGGVSVQPMRTLYTILCYAAKAIIANYDYDKLTAKHSPVNSRTPPEREAQAESMGERQLSTYRSEDTADSTDSLKSNFEYYQHYCCAAGALQTCTDVRSLGSYNLKYTGPPPRLPNKEDLCIFLALHMENSPNCQEPSCKYVRNKQKETKFFKTGIVICEANKPKRIITMDCSTEDLHVVPKALLRFPNALRGCEVYLSRMPCISCAKLLIQAQVSQVYYWPNLEIQTTEVNLKNIEMEAEHVDNIFRESYITAAVYIPILDVETVKQRIFPRTGSPPDTKNTTPITSVYDHKRSPKLLEILNLAHIRKDKLFQESYRDDITKAIQSFQTLAGGIDTEIKENNFQEDKHAIQREPKYIHALQLCNLLAARNDSPNTGVGTLIYRKEDIVAVGYNGFPKGTVNSLFSQKDDGSCDQHAIICAEANAIILRTEDDLSDTELITTCEPCSVCENLIKAMKIKKIIWPNRDEKKQPEGATKDPTESHNAEEPTVNAADDEPA